VAAIIMKKRKSKALAKTTANYHRTGAKEK